MPLPTFKLTLSAEQAAEKLKNMLTIYGNLKSQLNQLEAQIAAIDPALVQSVIDSMQNAGAMVLLDEQGLPLPSPAQLAVGANVNP